MSQPLRAGVIGASGIGKHHAKWFNALGCEVAAFAGTSTQTVAAASQALQDLCGFAGRGYVGAEAMLDAEALDLVAVCSPPALHRDHFLAAARRGCHILCEKPLVWDPDKPVGQLLDEAAEMLETARASGLVGAVNTQYAAAVEPYWDLRRSAGAPARRDDFTSFFMHIDSRGGKRGAAGEKIWIELAPHPLSLLRAFAGTGAAVPGSEQCCIEERRVEAAFDYETAGGRTVQARIVVGNVPDGPLVRRFGVDDALVDYEGRDDEQGVYAAYLTLGDREMKTTDFMQASISRFVGAVRGEGQVLATLEDGLANLAMHLRLPEAGRAT